MVVRVALVALMALGLAGFGAVAWFSTRPVPPSHAAAAPPPPPPAKVRILVAAHAVRAGSIVKPDDLGATAYLPADVPPGATVDTMAARASLLGALVRHSLLQNAPIIAGDLMRPGDHGFVAAVLAPGMRALTVPMQSHEQDGALLWPGDHIDLILVYNAHGANGAVVPEPYQYSAETILSDLRVVAVDQQLVQGVSADAANAKSVRTITLEVTPGQAERIAIAMKLGTLVFSIRAVDHPGKTPSDHEVTWAGDVSPALRNNRGNSLPTNATVRVFGGASQDKEFHF